MEKKPGVCKKGFWMVSGKIVGEKDCGITCKRRYSDFKNYMPLVVAYHYGLLKKLTMDFEG